MSDNLELLGLDQATLDSAEAQDVKSFKPLASGVYDGTVKELLTFTTEKGAGMLKAVINITSEKDRDITIYQNVKKKDGSVNEIGQATFKHVLDACNKTVADIAVKVEEALAYGKKIDCNVVKGLEKSKIKVGVRSIFEEGAKFEEYNEIEIYMRADGTNVKGESLVEAYAEKVAKKPVLNRVAKEGAKTSGSAGATKTAAGDNVDSML